MLFEATYRLNCIHATGKHRASFITNIAVWEFIDLAFDLRAAAPIKVEYRINMNKEAGSAVTERRLVYEFKGRLEAAQRDICGMEPG